MEPPIRADGSLALDNAGLVATTGGIGSFLFQDTALVSTGALQVDIGTLAFPGPVEHTGSTQIAAGATLVLQGTALVGPLPADPPTAPARLFNPTTIRIPVDPGLPAAHATRWSPVAVASDGPQSLRWVLRDLAHADLRGTVRWSDDLRAFEWASRV